MKNANFGIHTITVGAFEVTAIHDGMLHAPSLDFIIGVDADVAASVLKQHFRAVPPLLTVNAFLIRHAGGLALVDTGSNDKMGPGHGQLIDNLALMGIRPADISTVLLTHVHTDHAGGLTGPDGAVMYPNAELVMAANELDFWLDETSPVPDKIKPGKAFASATLGAYRDRLRPVSDNAEGLPGITRVSLPGHTPGHSGWRLDSGSDSLLIWGDIVHMPGLQFARPDATLVYDLDPAMAEASRRHIFDITATDGLRVAGHHMDFPTFGHVERRGDAYGFIADQWMATA